MKKQKIKVQNKKVEASNLVKKYTTGAVSATIWNNESINEMGEIVEFKTISFSRSYLDKKTNEWKNTSTLRASDLPKALLVLSKAYEYLTLKEDTEVIVEGDF